MDEQQELADGLGAQLGRVRDEDAVQDGYLRVVQRRGSGHLANPQSYWYTASRNALRDRHRRRAAEDRAIRKWLEIQSPQPEPDRWSDQQCSDLHQGIAQLEGSRRQLVDLELAGLLEGRALAAALGISEGAVRVLRHRTYRQLRALLSG